MPICRETVRPYKLDLRHGQALHNLIEVHGNGICRSGELRDHIKCPGASGTHEDGQRKGAVSCIARFSYGADVCRIVLRAASARSRPAVSSMIGQGYVLPIFRFADARTSIGASQGL